MKGPYVQALNRFIVGLAFSSNIFLLRTPSFSGGLFEGFSSGSERLDRRTTPLVAVKDAGEIGGAAAADGLQLGARSGWTMAYERRF